MEIKVTEEQLKALEKLDAWDMTVNKMKLEKFGGYSGADLLDAYRCGSLKVVKKS